ncbi:aspartyl/asparaginyl beta-hydroxylase-like [Liolophura sinensis]|uniref:aspartyl/asparaginyl beta-hydroxylase-like n=1 Tax=Liolophura sinensis TaxID=3198878 RepID=UPI003159633F
MGKAARRRHANDGENDSGKALRNGSSYHSRGDRHSGTTESPAGLSPLKLCLLVVTVATGGLVAAYFLNEDAQSVIHSTLLHYGIPDFLQFTGSNPAEDAGQREQTQRQPKKTSYTKSSITNSADKKIRSELDDADSYREKGQIEKAMEKYNAILKRYPKSPRALYGKAENLDKLAEKKQSNTYLEEAIQTFLTVLDLENVPDDLVIQTGRRAAERMNFRGWSAKAVKTLRGLTQRFPQNVALKNELGVAYLMVGKTEEARPVFKAALEIDPKNGFALVHLGFIYKTADNDPAKAIPLLREGINTKAEGTVDGRFYFHLGDSLQRVGQKEEAYEVYKAGADLGLFLSMYQRSLYNVDHLTGRPWWTPEQTTYKKYLKLLEDNWKVIRDEGLAQMDLKSGAFLPEEENLREKGDWKQFTLYQRGQKNKKNCQKVPKTCALIDQIPAAKGCKRGQVKYSVMQPGVHVWPHCGPTNCRIRAHLGLVVPDGPRISVAGQEGKWVEGKFIIFDDSFEHEVWHDGNSFRLVLIVDFWHPELSDHEKANLSPI